MNTELNYTWVKKFSVHFHFVVIAYGTYIKHQVYLLLYAKIVSIFCRAYTTYIQAPNVCWNKPFKVIARGKCGKRPAKEGINQLESTNFCRELETLTPSYCCKLNSGSMGRNHVNDCLSRHVLCHMHVLYSQDINGGGWHSLTPPYHLHPETENHYFRAKVGNHQATNHLYH